MRDGELGAKITFVWVADTVFWKTGVARVFYKNVDGVIKVKHGVSHCSKQLMARNKLHEKMSGYAVPNSGRLAKSNYAI